MNPGDNFYGIDASLAVSPFVNNDNYSLTAISDNSGTYSDVDFDAVGIFSSTAVAIENFGNISLMATGGTANNSGAGSALADPDVLGIWSQGSITNAGNLAITGIGGTATAVDFADSGIDVFGIYSSASVVNTGDISATGQGGVSSSQTSYPDNEAQVSGISAIGDVANSGAITTYAAGGTGTSLSGDDTYAFGQAFGINAGGGVTNSGTLSVTAQGGYFNQQGYGSSEGFAKGIDAGGDVSNTGAINVTSTGGTAISSADIAHAEAWAHGIESDGAVANSGAITVTAQGGTSNGAASWILGDAVASVVGINADGDVANNGSIIVTATGGTATAPSSEPFALAIGVLSDSNITNTGNITTTATYGNGTGFDTFSSSLGAAHAAAAGIIATSGNVNNSGDITVTAIAPETYDTAAVGILFLASGTLTSTGVIQASADRAYEVAVMAGTVTLGEAYNINLDGDPTVGSLFVNDGATLVLNGTALSVSSVGGSFSPNIEYRIFETEGGTGVVSGEFGEVTALNPNMAVLYNNQSTVESVDDTVSLSFQPVASPRLEATDLLRHTINLTSDLVGQRLVTGFLQPRLTAGAPRMYAAAQTVVNDGGRQSGSDYTGGFFFTPYYANVDKDSDPVGYDADLVGFVTGLERRAKGNLYGFHLGFNHAGVDFTGNGFSNNQEDQELLSAGMHLMGSRNDWTWRGQLTGFYGWHDYDGMTGPTFELRESADYDSHGVRAALLAGRAFKRGGQILLPEAGLEYLWLHSESFTTDADNPGWNVHNDSIEEHQGSAIASLRWLTRLQAGDMEVTPSVAAGIRYLLTDDELDAHQSVADSAPVTVKADQDDVIGTVSASVLLSKEQLATELAYAGEFGDETTMHAAWLRFHCLY